MSDFLKLPPHSKELEQYVLASILYNNSFYNDIADILTWRDFYHVEYEAIAKNLFEALEKGEQYTDLDVVMYIKKNNLNHALIDELLTHNSGVKSLFIRHSLKIKEYSMLRSLMKLSTEITQKANYRDADCFEIISDSQEELTKLIAGIRSAQISTIHDVAVKTYIELEKASKIKDMKLRGLPTFSNEINRLTGGFIEGGMSIIAGRAGEGKTAALLQCCISMLNDGISTGIISLEMSKEKLMQRLYSNLCRINGFDIRDANLSDEQLEAMKNKAMELVKANIYIADDPYIDEKKLRPIIRNMVTKYKVKAVFIDYFQLIKCDGNENTVTKNENLSQSLQRIAREFNIALVALSQQARTGNNRPTMESLRGGGIEQASDLIINLFDESYQTEGKPEPEIEMLAIISKSKHGSTGDVPIRYNKTFQTLEDSSFGYGMPRLDHYQKKMGYSVKSNDLF
jgi:replicative DNA helicase